MEKLGESPLSPREEAHAELIGRLTMEQGYWSDLHGRMERSGAQYVWRPKSGEYDLVSADRELNAEFKASDMRMNALLAELFTTHVEVAPVSN